MANIGSLYALIFTFFVIVGSVIQGRLAMHMYKAGRIKSWQMWLRSPGLEDLFRKDLTGLDEKYVRLLKFMRFWVILLTLYTLYLIYVIAF